MPHHGRIHVAACAHRLAEQHRTEHKSIDIEGLALAVYAELHGYNALLGDLPDVYLEVAGDLADADWRQRHRLLSTGLRDIINSKDASWF